MYNREQPESSGICPEKGNVSTAAGRRKTLEGDEDLRAFQSIGHYFKHTDLYLLILSILASSYGIALIYSATRSYETDKFIIVQAVGMGLGIVAFIIMSLIEIDNLARYWKILFLVNIVLQCSLFVFGQAEGGNRSWIRFGSIGIQPAEIGKVLFVLTFAAHMITVKERMNNWKYLLSLMMHLLIIMGIIVISSDDVGMSLSYLFICAIMLFAGGLSGKWFAAAGILGVASIPFIWNFALGDFQKKRILVLFDPTLDPDTSYQATQSRMAIGSGQVTGEGFMQGRQVQYGALPAKHTDFIFAVAGEELGFIGAMAVVILLALIILRIFYVTYKANTPYSALVCVGIGGMILFQTFENILMCLGLGPVMGLTLPFFSYGGTSLVTMYLAVGIVAGVRMREKPSWLQ